MKFFRKFAKIWITSSRVQQFVRWWQKLARKFAIIIGENICENLQKSAKIFAKICEIYCQKSATTTWRRSDDNEAIWQHDDNNVKQIFANFCNISRKSVKIFAKFCEILQKFASRRHRNIVVTKSSLSSSSTTIRRRWSGTTMMMTTWRQQWCEANFCANFRKIS